jgi:hypothetical protein
MRGDKSAATDCLTFAAEIAFMPFNKGNFPRDKVEAAAAQTLDDLGFKEDIDVYGHVLGRVPKKRIHSLFFQKIKYILFQNESNFMKEFGKQLLIEIKELTESWGAESNGQEEVAD